MQRASSRDASASTPISCMVEGVVHYPRPVSRLQFHRFVDPLTEGPLSCFDALNYAAHVPAKDKKGFEEAVRRDTSLPREATLSSH